MKTPTIKKTVIIDEPLRSILKKAVAAIDDYDYSLAKELLKEASAIDMENPEIFNLLGILHEKEGDYIEAAKCYRVAYYLDQTFSAASENLDRIGDLWGKKDCNFSWGLERIGG